MKITGKGNYLNYFILFYILIFKVFNCLSQQNQLISFGAGTFSLGAIYGVRPNYTANFNEGYIFGEFEQALQIRAIPVKLSGRISEEPYRSGRASYFRASYDSYGFKRNELERLDNKLDSLKSLQGFEMDSLHKLEGKLSYLNQINYEQKQALLDSIKFAPLSNQINFLDTTKLISFSNPLNPQVLHSTIPVLDTFIIRNLINDQKEILSSLNSEVIDTESEINNLNNKKNLGFLQGIRKFDLGLSSLSPSSLSNNAIPIQGIHISGVVKKTYYDVASGFTLKNQLFSNQVFDQLINNSSNVFNLGNFFSVNNVRFVNSAIIGVGEKGTNSIEIENFYTGRPFEDIRNHIASAISLNNALTVCFTPKKLDQLTLSTSIGQSNILNDSNEVRLNDKMVYKGGLVVRLPKIGGSFESMFRSLGSEYNGFSQGIYISNSTHGEFTYNQEVGSRLKSMVRYSEDIFSSHDTINHIRKTKQGTLSLNLKASRNTTISSTYSLVEAVGDTLISPHSHLGQLNVNNSIRLKKNFLITNLSAGYVSIAGQDSLQKIMQFTWQSDFRTEKWFVGLKTSFENFSGLQRMYGSNLICQPEFGFTSKMTDISFAYQLLVSDQFSQDYGLIANFNFRPSAYVTWHFSAQKWLERDTYFFLQDANEYVKPYFVKIRLSIHLNVKK